MGWRNPRGDLATPCKPRAGVGAGQQKPPPAMGTGLLPGPEPQHGGPHGAPEPGARPALPHHGRVTGCGAGWGRTVKMNEGVGRVMALSGK